PDARPGSRYLPLMPPLRGHLGMRYERGRASSRSWNLGTALRAGAAQRNVGDFETASASYALLELTGGLRFLVAGRFHAVTLRVDNATDTAWRNHLSRTKDIMPEAGRNFSLLYRVSF
ncbi:MAG TPA: hypothetical protein VE869_13880, partial [Gemmatimonas sp.]|nr:hypothetical protein [Gemmatimonas sp.]